MDPTLAQLVSTDPARPWPGVSRHQSERVAGLRALVGDRWVEGPLRDHDEVTPALILPTATLTSSADPGVELAAAAARLPIGGHLVTEEPGLDDVAELEPLAVDGTSVTLASVVRVGDQLDVAVMTFANVSEQTTAATAAVQRARVTPLSADEIDAIAAVNGLELVGRWQDWSGTPAAEGWKISVHRRRT